MKKIAWNENGWTALQDADAKKHILEVDCRTENGTVVEIRIRHNDGEEVKGKALCAGLEVLPISLEEFKKLFEAGSLKFE